MGKEQTEPDRESTPGVDFISSIVLMAFSLVVGVWSLNMPRPGGWSSAPGLVPLFLAVCIFFMGLALLISSVRRGAAAALLGRLRRFSLNRFVSRVGVRRTFWIVLLTAVYVFVLLGRVLFELASFLYLVATLALFWRKGGWLKIILVSVLLPIAVSLVFRVLFVVLMPGGSVFDWLRIHL